MLFLLILAILIFFSIGRILTAIAAAVIIGLIVIVALAKSIGPDKSDRYNRTVTVIIIGIIVAACFVIGFNA